MIRNKTNILLFIILLITNLFWIYHFIDQSLTVDHQQRAIELTYKDYKVIEEVSSLLFKEENHDCVLKLLNTKITDHLIKEDGDSLISIDNVGLKFENKHLKKFYFNYYE